MINQLLAHIKALKFNHYSEESVLRFLVSPYFEDAFGGAPIIRDFIRVIYMIIPEEKDLTARYILTIKPDRLTDIGVRPGRLKISENHLRGILGMKNTGTDYWKDILRSGELGLGGIYYCWEKIAE